LQNTLSKSAEKKASPSEGEAEGGCGGNSASPEPKRSPAALLSKSRPTKKSFVFLLEEKNRRAQIKNCGQNFSLAEREIASGGGAERQNSAFGFSLKKVRISFSVRSKNKNEHFAHFYFLFWRQDEALFAVVGLPPLRILVPEQNFFKKNYLKLDMFFCVFTRKLFEFELFNIFWYNLSIGRYPKSLTLFPCIPTIRIYEKIV
jgi:hypothetical protein